jgi:inosose dehydratase
MRGTSLTRRQALAGVTTALLPSWAAAAGYKPKISVATYIWVQQFGFRKIAPIDGLEEAYSSLHRAGYRYVELINSFLQGDLRAKTVALMKKYKLRCSLAYHGGPMHESAGAEKTIAVTMDIAQAAKSLGAAGMVLNPSPLPKGARKSDDELRIEADNVNKLGRQLQALGMRLMLHHHEPEMRENAREWRHLLQNTDPQLVWTCLDTDWIRYGKQDVLGLVKESGKRTGDIHLRNTQNGVWMEDFGPGDIDYVAVAAYLKSIGYNGYLAVELAYARETRVTRSMEEDLRRSREYTEKTFGVKA